MPARELRVPIREAPTAAACRKNGHILDIRIAGALSAVGTGRAHPMFRSWNVEHLRRANDLANGVSRERVSPTGLPALRCMTAIRNAPGVVLATDDLCGPLARAVVQRTKRPTRASWRFGTRHVLGVLSIRSVGRRPTAEAISGAPLPIGPTAEREQP